MGAKIGRAMRYGWRLILRALPYLAYLRSYFQPGPHIDSVSPAGPIALGPKVALFIHFDSRARLAEHTKRYVAALAASGFSVVFVTNSGLRYQADIDALTPLCRAIIMRRNIGYDFGAMRDAIHHLQLPRPDTDSLLLANDSVYGPLAPLQPVLDRIDFAQADIWGATESWQTRYHLQSYFLMFGRAALNHPNWRMFWDGVRQVSSKPWVINRYEIGLTQMMLQAGLRCRALWPYHELLTIHRRLPLPETEDEYDPFVLAREATAQRTRAAASRAVPLNPTAELWRPLLLSGFPFVKVELLGLNPSGVPDAIDWRAALAELPGADIEMIERDLQRRVRNRAP